MTWHHLVSGGPEQPSGVQEVTVEWWDSSGSTCLIAEGTVKSFKNSRVWRRKEAEVGKEMTSENIEFTKEEHICERQRRTIFSQFLHR